MRTCLRHIAVLVPLVLIVVLAAAPASAQYKINTFDTVVADSLFVISFNGSANATEPNAIHTLSNDAGVKVEGAASLKNVWRVHTTESWGGLNMLSYTLPTKGNNGYYQTKYRALHGDSTYINWGDGTNLTLWYNNTKKSTATGNGVQMRFHIYEAGPGSTYYTGDSTDYEDWYYQSPLPLNDTVPGWHKLVIPLEDLGKTNNPNDVGFSLTDWSGKNKNNKLDWNNIIGYTIEWTAGKVAGDTSNGIVFYDDLRLEGIGNRSGSEAVYRFNNFGQDTTHFASGWNNGGLSSWTWVNETADTLIGPTNSMIDWKINVKESWGGGTNREYNLPDGTFMPDLSSKSELLFWMKVIQPLTSSTGTVANKVTLRFVLFDYSDGTKEEWYTIADVALDSIGVARGWQQVRIPLDAIQSGQWGDLKTGRFNTPNGTKDGIVAWNKIGGFKLEFSASRDAGEPYADNLVISGKLLLSSMTPAGFRETDHTPPAAVSGLQATTTAYANIVTWSDVAGETGATYTVYVSDKPFTKTDDPGVENVPPFGLPTGTQLQTHVLRSPNTDRSLPLYYGVTATDKAGNTNDPTVIGPITNTAKGVPTISKTGPTSFVADGDLSEWAGITPFLLSVNPSTPTCHPATNTTIGGDADLMARAYVAATAQALYVAFDVDDDVVSIDTASSASDWLQDSPDIYIGLYDWRGPWHSSYRHGATPDYHLRFSQHQLKADNDGKVLMKPGTDYAFVVKQITSGYTVEARIPWGAFKTMQSDDSVFTPVEGMRIPLDFSVNDNDTPGNNTAREGIMCYAPLNNDNSYSDVWRWSYTWIGNKMTTTGVEGQVNEPIVYQLMQNYPNPFNPSTVIRYSLAQAGPVTVKVFDVLGREIAVLVNGEVQSAGNHVVNFGTASVTRGLSSGTYFYEIRSGAFRDIKKMMLIK
jgi:hypothetical protein